jgi:small subunit ribosomal protein S1
MSNPNNPETSTTSESTESFDQLLSEYERTHTQTTEGGARRLQGVVVAVTADSVLLDIGFKSEGTLPLTDFSGGDAEVKPGDTFIVSVKGRDTDGYYQLSRQRIAQPKDWSSLEQAFNGKATIVGTVTGVVKGGLSVDVGVRAFMPASRSGAREASEMEKLVGQEIQCRITKLDVGDEDVVVDRRVVMEDEARSLKESRYATIREGDTVHGTVRTLAEYGAFVDLGGFDGLLHVSDLAWSRVSKPDDVLAVGQEIEAIVLKVDADKQRISLGLKQLQSHPWDSVPDKYKVGDRIRGVVTRTADFGAFVELDPGVEGLIHISEMSWNKKVRTPSDLVKPGEVVEAVILGISPSERRIALGLKQAMGDPWADAAKKFPIGVPVEGTVTSLPKFGAFVQLMEGVEGLIHISEITAERRLNHPQEVLKMGQTIKAQVLSVDAEKRLIRLSMKQLVPTDLDEYLAEHKLGDIVNGRVINVASEDGAAKVEFGDGVYGVCLTASVEALGENTRGGGAAGDISSISSMLMARWKGNSQPGPRPPDPLQPGQIRQFRITRLDCESKLIEVSLA